MGEKVKRPWSVWIAQIVFVYCVLMYFLAFILAMMTTTPSERFFVGFLFTTIVGVGSTALFVTAFWGMATRKPYGRWLGVGMLSVMLIFLNVEQIFFGSDTGRLIVKILLSVLLFVVILHISLSDKASAFFARKIKPTRIDHPPPPPSFDD
jgi:hypothetical protein